VPWREGGTQGRNAAQAGKGKKKEGRDSKKRTGSLRARSKRNSSMQVPKQKWAERSGQGGVGVSNWASAKGQTSKDEKRERDSGGEEALF